MSEDRTPPGQAQASTPPALARACDLCRRRKIRCERTFPCSNCQRMGVDCKITRRTVRQKHKRVLISAEYEKKIDHIDKSLDRLNRLVDQFLAGNSRLPVSMDLMTPSVESMSSTAPASSCSGPPELMLRTVPVIEGNTKLSNNTAVTPPKDIAKSEVLIEGQSSLTAHSEFAIGFLHSVVECHQGLGDDGSEVTGLLDTLRHMVDTFHHQRLSPKPLFPLAKSVSPGNHEGCPLPPLEAVIAVIQKSQVENNFTYLCLSHFLTPRSLSDVCLKVYFSREHSDAEFIIIHVAILFLSGNSSNSSNDADGDEQLRLLCRTNLETRLSGLSLYVMAGYDMIVALVLGAMYAIDISNVSLAWTLVTAASQSSHYLSLHIRGECMDASAHTPAQRPLLFWVVYFLEKTLCLRLGRSSTIPDSDITAPYPGNISVHFSHALEYFHHQVMLASLAGKIYEQLYSGNALQLPAAARTNRARGLAEQLNKYAAEAHQANQLWEQSTTNDHSKEELRFMFVSDEIMRLSMLTLIHRIGPVPQDSITTFNKECVSSARAALERHREFVAELGTHGSPFMSVYINWTILFTPFIPFIVLFCHVIETGDLEDLSRMQTFVTSMEGSCHNSSAIAKHYRLFQIFHGVAARYTELMCSSVSMHEEQRKLKSQMDKQLSALGLQPNGSHPVGHPTAEAAPGISSATVDIEIPGLGQPPPDQDWPPHGLLLGNWFSFNQQMMGLMDQNDLPF